MTGRLLTSGRTQCSRFWIVALLSIALAVVAARPPVARAVGVNPDCAEAWRERGLDDVSRPASQVTLALDVANNAYIARVIDGRIEIGIVGSGFETNLVVEVSSGVQADPTVATTSAGETFVAFSESTGETPDSGRDVFLARIVGGSLSTPRNLSASDQVDHGPRIALDSRGRPHLVWTRREGGQSGIVYWNDAMVAPRVVADDGESPSVFVSDDDRVYIAYVRGHDVAYVQGQGDVFEPELPVTKSPFVPESSASIVVDAAGAVTVVYERTGSLYLTRKPPDGVEFETPRLLEADGVLDPKAILTWREELLIAYIKDSDVYHLLGPPGSLGGPVRITETDAVESQPTVDMDGHGTIHVTFMRDSEVRYATNACEPDVDFAADPRAGRVPLTVRFTDLSSRTAESWEWDFGDGGISRSQNPEHTYQDPGVYTVRLKVSAPGGVSSAQEIEEFIVVEDPLNSLEILDQQVISGQPEMWFPVIASHIEPIQGFQLMGTYDPAFLRLVRTDLSFTAVDRFVPDFFETRIFETYFEVGYLLDILPPFDGTVLPPSKSQRLVHLIFDVSNDAPQGETTEVRLVNDKRISRIFNIFIVDGFNRLPALKGSTVKIRLIESPFPRIFVRGDFDSDGSVTVSDAIGLLSFLFVGGGPPACLDAADFGDVGRIDLSAAVGILNFLFAGGQAPLPPFPNRGLDPSDDELGECKI